MSIKLSEILSLDVSIRYFKYKNVYVEDEDMEDGGGWISVEVPLKTPFVWVESELTVTCGEGLILGKDLIDENGIVYRCVKPFTLRSTNTPSSCLNYKIPSEFKVISSQFKEGDNE